MVVEGYTDVIALHQAGMESAVATCGTALGEDHLEVLGRLGERIVLAFDADRAGSDAVLRGERVSRRSGRRLDLRVAELPDGKDPADLLQDGRLEDLRQAVNGARPALQYRIERRLAEVDPTEPESRARAVEELGPLLAAIGDSTIRGEYEKVLSLATGVNITGIKEVVARGPVKHSVERPSRRREPPSRPRHPTYQGSPVERELLKAVLSNHPVLREVEVDETLFAKGPYRRIFQEIEADWRASPPGEPTPITWAVEEPSEDRSPEESPFPAEMRLTLLEIASEQSEPGDPRTMVIRCRQAALGREAAAIRSLMGSLARDDPMRDQLLGRLGQLESRRQELTGDLQ